MATVVVEITTVKEEDCCRSAVEELKSTAPVFVYCHLKGEEVTYVVCVSKSCAFNFKTDLLEEGNLREFLNDASTEAKVFHCDIFIKCNYVLVQIYDVRLLTLSKKLYHKALYRQVALSSRMLKIVG